MNGNRIWETDGAQKICYAYQKLKLYTRKPTLQHFYGSGDGQEREWYTGKGFDVSSKQNRLKSWPK